MIIIAKLIAIKDKGSERAREFSSQPMISASNH